MAGLVGSSTSPISGVGIVAIVLVSLLMLALGGELLEVQNGVQMAIALSIFSTSAVVAVASISNDNLQDLKTGWLVGATPWRQQVALLIGCVVGAAVISPVLELLYNAYGFADAMPRDGMDPAQALSAPQATLMLAIARGIFTHQLNWTMILIGMAVGVGLIVVDEILKRTCRVARIPVLAVGIGIYLPPTVAAPIVAGAVLAWLLERALRRRAAAAGPATAAAPPAAAEATAATAAASAAPAATAPATAAGKAARVPGEHGNNQANDAGQAAGQQRGGEQERRQCSSPAAEQPTQRARHARKHPAQDAAGKHADEQGQKPGVAAAVGLAAPLATDGRRQVFAIDQLDQHAGGVSDAASIVTTAEARHQVFLDDPVGDGIGNRALQAVTGLDAYPSVILGHHQQHAVIHALAADLPLVEDARAGCPCAAAGQSPAAPAPAAARYPACRWYRPPANPAPESAPTAAPATPVAATAAGPAAQWPGASVSGPAAVPAAAAARCRNRPPARWRSALRCPR
ncbi:hypothetical protein G6F22_012055 [Rhizopus arrhizus]|nr:hypothetical protein G6F22_012055 [Rhizopus arrhizus]